MRTARRNTRKDFYVLFYITAVSPADQPIKAIGHWTVDANSGEQALSRLFRSDVVTSDLWPLESDWTVEPIEQEDRKRA